MKNLVNALVLGGSLLSCDVLYAADNNAGTPAAAASDVQQPETNQTVGPDAQSTDKTQATTNVNRVAQPTDAAALSASLQQVTAQTAQLQKQVALLQAQLKRLQAQKAATATKAPVSAAKTPAGKTVDLTVMPPVNKPVDRPLFIHSLDNGVTVTTSPYLGLRSAYNASDLLVNLPSMNEDLVLLQQRQDMEKKANAAGLPFGDRPLVMISGDITGQGVIGNTYQNVASSDVTLSGVELDVNAIASRWASGFMAFNYDNSTPTSGNVSRVSNSRVYVSRGFLTIGNLNEAPWYLSMGQMYAPFGRYANSMVTNPLTQSLARVLARSAVAGYSDGNLYGEVYAFNGDTYITNNGVINQGGVNLGYQNTAGELSYNFGGGVISNMAESQTAQKNGNSTSNQFQGFGASSSAEQLIKRVPGGDIHSELSYGHYSLSAEYISALQSYSASNMSFNGNGAAPKAMYIEGDYNTQLMTKPCTFGLSYGRTWQSLAYNLPRRSLMAVASTSFWKDTIESIEFRHDNNYKAGTQASGNGATVPMTPTGSDQNTVTAQVGIYF